MSTEISNCGGNPDINIKQICYPAKYSVTDDDNFRFSSAICIDTTQQQQRHCCAVSNIQSIGAVHKLNNVASNYSSVVSYSIWDSEYRSSNLTPSTSFISYGRLNSSVDEDSNGMTKVQSSNPAMDSRQH
ncbi:hypothetical protein OUZ56_020336 [Daphnia magna]|uniref:Uncharacterized protein n=1 Tax=Daphnia magna TaxID=35525 RepID=A0ABQ9ZE79_9CRUS|nr:hypothetical protein OUZ56_020336 [Daphnia magna]